MERDCIVPEDLLVDIFSRRSVRCLLSLTCVCKSWCGLIDYGSFIRKHYQVQYDIRKANGSFPLFLTNYGIDEQVLRVCLLSKQQGDVVVLNMTPDLARGFNTGLCVGVVNGIICFLWNSTGLGLWNPATREFKAVPHWLDIVDCDFGPPLETIGFGFDPVSNDFKIVAGNMFEEMIVVGNKFVSSEPTARYKVFSLTTNSWETVRESRFSFGPRHDVMDAYFNGACYWTGGDHEGKIPVVLSFNFSTEVFNVFDLPEDALVIEMAGRSDSEWKIEVCMESLALIVNHVDLEKAISRVDIWVVTKFHDDFGVPLLSWQHFFTSDQIPAFNGLRVELDTLLMDGNMLVLIRSDDPNEEESSLYNPSTGTFKKLGASYCYESCIYLESLFPLSKRLVNVCT